MTYDLHTGAAQTGAAEWPGPQSAENRVGRWPVYPRCVYQVRDQSRGPKICCPQTGGHRKRGAQRWGQKSVPRVHIRCLPYRPRAQSSSGPRWAKMMGAYPIRMKHTYDPSGTRLANVVPPYFWDPAATRGNMQPAHVLSAAMIPRVSSLLVNPCYKQISKKARIGNIRKLVS